MTLLKAAACSLLIVCVASSVASAPPGSPAPGFFVTARLVRGEIELRALFSAVRHLNEGPQHSLGKFEHCLMTAAKTGAPALILFLFAKHSVEVKLITGCCTRSWRQIIWHIALFELQEYSLLTKTR